MKANELRLGNWVNNKEGQLFEVIGIHDDVLHCVDSKVDRIVIHITNIKPIPLTPEILEQCGFVKELLDADPIDGYYWLLDLPKEKFFDMSFINGDKNGMFEVMLHPYDNIRFLYLHQLQNLFFALIGTELSFTPKPSNDE